MIYSVWIVSPVNYLHSNAFLDVAKSLNAALIELGHESRIVTSSFECRGKTIILGAQLLGKIPVQDLPHDMVIWNLEQIFEGNPWLGNDYLELLRGYREDTSLRYHRTFEVWDYSQSNIEALAKMGIEAKLVTVGYMPCLTVIENNPEPDIDVLLYGSMTERRMDIINQLALAGVKVHGAYGIYGVARDALIARSKIVLNVHFYESKVFEIVRCSYLMANRKCVVSEFGYGGEEYAEGICFAEYDNLVDRCVGLLADDEAREELAQKGFEIFGNMSQVDYLRGVL